MTTRQPILGLICRHFQFERGNLGPINEKRRVKNGPSFTPVHRNFFFDPLSFFDEFKRSSSSNVDSIDIRLHSNP